MISAKTPSASGQRPGSQRPRRAWLAVVVLCLAALACARSVQGEPPEAWRVSGLGGTPPPTLTPFAPGEATPLLLATRTRNPNDPLLTPTPDDPHRLPAARSEPEQYVVQPADSLGVIAQRFGVSLDELLAANNLTNPNLLSVGQVLTIPAPIPEGTGLAFKVIPDSELVNGPLSAVFDVKAFVQGRNGYLARYEEELDEKKVSGVQIVERVARNYSVNPRLLLAVLEHQSGWVTRAEPPQDTRDFPLGNPEQWRKGLYRQLAWAANQLNRGYYVWRVGGARTWLLGTGRVISIDPTINAGTAGVQNFFAQLYGRDRWEEAVGPDGLYATYTALFGHPFDYAIEPLLPAAMRQPAMQLPFEPGVVWSFTGGPHGGWDSGSAWAALDFAPPSEALGCLQSNVWVTAVADGLIVRAEDGAVVQDLDGDGYEQTGWTVLYMHIESRDRVKPGAFLKAGERIGHPSCEGGVSSGTHLHLARRFNGEWIPADQTLPFILDGWISRGAGDEYDGYLDKNELSIEAYEGRSPISEISR